MATEQLIGVGSPNNSHIDTKRESAHLWLLFFMLKTCSYADFSIPSLELCLLNRGYVLSKGNWWGREFYTRIKVHK